MKRKALLILMASVLAVALFLTMRGTRTGPFLQSQELPSESQEDVTPSSGTSPETPGGSSSISPSSAQSPLSPEDQRKISVLNEIFKSKNDNDPRIDTELRVLSEPAKAGMLQQYRSLEPEKRNERGTIVFLIGRNLRTDGDFQFFCDVLREPPCVSLAKCSGDPSTAGREDFEHEAGEEITLAYPQIVALVALQQFLTAEATRSGPQASAALRALDCAKDSRVAAVLDKAAQVNQAISKRSSGS